MRKWDEFGKVQVTINEIDYEVEVVGTFSRYMDGQDADGNRGHMVTDMDDMNIYAITPEPTTTEQREAVENIVCDLNADDITWDERDEREEA